MFDPTPEQIEAAYQAWINYPHKRGPQNAENAIKAALVAAAGAAQGATLPDDRIERAVLVSAISRYEYVNFGRKWVDLSDREQSDWIRSEGRLIPRVLAAAGISPQCQCYGADGVTDEKCPACVTPVQVDEAKLAEVIFNAWYSYDPRSMSKPELETARAVAEWLRGGGHADRDQ